MESTRRAEIPLDGFFTIGVWISDTHAIETVRPSAEAPAIKWFLHMPLDAELANPKTAKKLTE